MQISTKTDNKWPWIEQSTNAAARLICFVFWPFGAWLSALFDANKKSSFIVFFLFDLLLLWHMAPTGYSSGYQDFIGIMEKFQMNNKSFSDILYALKEFFTFSDDAPKEIYEDVLTWFVKSFIADNYHFYFLVAAIPIAYCQLNVLHKIIMDYRSSMCFALFSILVLLIIPRDIIGAQNPRFTTGFWLCTMCSISYFAGKKNPLFILMVLCSPIFHSAMWPFVFLFLAGVLLQKVERPLEVAACISIPLVFIDFELFRDINLDILPSSLSAWATRYMSDESYARFILRAGRSGFWWLDSFFKIVQKIIYIYMTLKIIADKETVKRNIESANMYSFYLLVFTYVNMIQFVPELGNRYYGFLRIFCVFIWFKAFYPKKNKVIYVLLGATLWYIFHRYGYVLGGALSVNTPIDIFFMPLPYLMGKGVFW